MNPENNIREEKMLLRQIIREKKKQYAQAWREQVSTLILDRLEQTTLFQEASCLLFYHGLPDEVQTNRFLKKWYRQKQLILPVVVNNDLILRVYQPDHLQPGSFGILEPTGLVFEQFEKIDLAIIPGMAFDRSGNRLGRGKGYYDRLLPQIKAPKIGIAFNWQLLDNIPVESFDQRLDGILTETEYTFNTNAF